MNAHMTTGKTALITAASGGIGKSIALKLARDGYHIGIHYRSNLEEAVRIQREAESFGVRAELFQGDAEKTEQMVEMARGFIACFGRMDVLINNAGITVLRSFLDVDEKLMHRLWAADWETPYFVAQEAARCMIRERTGGSIINITSVQAKINFPDASVYGPIKAALVKLTEHMAVELAQYGIRVNAVAPGYINTADSESARAQYIKSRIPLQRLGKGEDVAEMVAFLCSDAGAYITGANIPIDGGMPLPSAADNYYTPRIITDKLG